MQIGAKEHLHTYSSCFPSSGLNFKAITNKEKKQNKTKTKHKNKKPPPQWMSAIISSYD